MLDAAAYNDLQNYIKRRLAHARYRVGPDYFDVPFNDITIHVDGTVRVQFSIHPSGTVAVNWVGLLNNAGDVWAHQDVNITVDTNQTGVLYWFDFKVSEVA